MDFFPLQKVKWSILRTYNYEFFHVKISRVVSSEMLYSLQFRGFTVMMPKSPLKATISFAFIDFEMILLCNSKNCYVLSDFWV